MTIIWTSDEFCRIVQLLLYLLVQHLYSPPKKWGAVLLLPDGSGVVFFWGLNWDEKKSAIFMEKYRCHIIGDTSSGKKLQSNILRF